MFRQTVRLPLEPQTSADLGTGAACYKQLENHKGPEARMASTDDSSPPGVTQGLAGFVLVLAVLVIARPALVYEGRPAKQTAGKLRGPSTSLRLLARTIRLYNSFSPLLTYSTTFLAHPHGRFITTVSHEPFLLLVHGVAKFAHEPHVRVIQRSFVHGGNVLPELALVSRGRQDSMYVGIRKDESVTLSRRRNACALRPGVRTTEQVRPPCGGVAKNAGIVRRKVREDVPFGTTMGCVVAEHQGIHVPVCGQLAEEGTVVAGESDRTDFPFFFQFPQVFADSRCELRRFQHSHEQEYVDVIRPELAQALLKRCSNVLCPPDVVVRAGYEYELVPTGSHLFPQCTDHLDIKSKREKEVDSFIHGSIHGSPAGEIGCGKSEGRYADSCVAKGSKLEWGGHGTLPLLWSSRLVQVGYEFEETRMVISRSRCVVCQMSEAGNAHDRFCRPNFDTVIYKRAIVRPFSMPAISAQGVWRTARRHERLRSFNKIIRLVSRNSPAWNA